MTGVRSGANLLTPLTFPLRPMSPPQRRHRVRATPRQLLAPVDPSVIAGITATRFSLRPVHGGLAL